MYFSHHTGLLNERSFPRVLCRGDSRLPFTVLNTGFAGRGDDLVAHAQGDRAGNRNIYLAPPRRAVHWCEPSTTRGEAGYRAHIT